MFTNSGNLWAAPGIEVGAQMAVERINKESSLLTNLELELLVRDTQCNKDVAIYEYFSFMGNKSFPIAGRLKGNELKAAIALQCKLIGKLIAAV